MCAIAPLSVGGGDQLQFTPEDLTHSITANSCEEAQKFE